MSRLARVWRRWELSPQEQTALPFNTGITLLNARRVELAALLLFANDITEGAARGIPISRLVEIGIIFVYLPIAWWARTAGPRAQQVVVAIALAMAAVTTQWTVYEMTAESGHVPAGFMVRLLTLTLIFVLPPGGLIALVTGAYAIYVGVLLITPVPLGAQITAMVTGGIVVGISLVTGTMIHAARRSDHEQKLLIRAQNEELDQLMAITAHDLRSPLLGLRNLFDLAARRAATEPALPLRVMRDGIASLDAMLALVGRLLDAHRAEHAPLDRLAEDDLRGHVVAAAKRIAPRAEAAGVEVDVELATAPLCARFDADALAQILDNLLDNAVRFSPAGAPLRLAATAVGDRAVIAVEDAGPGVDRAHEQALFDKFNRGAQHGSSAKAGTGMGLFIAATFANRIGARLTHRPRQPHGAVFELSLPRTS